MSRDEDVFAAALALPADEREAFLIQACPDDPALRYRVEALLAGYVEAERAMPRARFASEMKPPEEKPGDRIGRYKLLEKVGAGGCGAVWMAEQEEPVRRRVALKVIKLGMDTKEVISRFEAERQALALMDHPNIAKIFDAGTTETGRPFFVMEFVRGMAITRFCDERRLSTQQRLHLFIPVCHAIQHAHHKGIIHRDIKPSNILVTLHDDVSVPKVIDFGIANATQGRLTNHTLFTAVEQFIGTPAYMSPEQVDYNSLDVDTRSDVYSLGVLLYELLTGRTPFDPKTLLAGGLEQIRRMIREVDPPRPSLRLDTLMEAERSALARQRGTAPTHLSTQLRGDLDWIAMRCLEKDRTRRYETANGLANDIQRHLDDEAVLARPPTAAYRFRKAFRRNKLIFIASATIAATLVIGIAVSTSQMLEAKRAQRETELARTGERQQRVAAESAQEIARTEQQRADVQARKASESQEHSRRLLYAADMSLAQQSINANNLGRARRLLERHRPQPGEEDLRGWEWRYVWQMTQSSALVTLAHRPTTRGWSVSFSPDGTRLAVGWLDGRVDLWDVPGRRLIRPLTTEIHLKHRGHVAFSPVRNFLAASSEPRVIKLYDLDSGEESVLWQASDKAAWRVCDLAFSPDGSRVIIYAKLPGSKNDEVTVVNVSSRQIESVHFTDFAPSEYGILGGARLSPDNRRLYLTRRYSICCLDLATNRELWETESEQATAFGLTTLTLSPNGQVLASCSGYEDPIIRIRDAATGKLVTELNGHTGWVGQVVFSEDGQRLISAGADQTIRIWNTNTWTEAAMMRGHTDEVHAVAISKRSQLVATASKDGTLALWRADGRSATDGYRRLDTTANRFEIRMLDGSRVLLLPAGKLPELLDLKRALPLGSLPEISADVGGMVGWYPPNILCHWNGTNRILVHELRGTEFVLRASIAPPSGTRPTWIEYNVARELLAWREKPSPKSIYLESLAKPGQRIELKSDFDKLRYVRFSQDGKFLASAGAGAVRAWNLDTGQVVASFDGNDTGDMTLAGNGSVLVAVTFKGNAHRIEFHDLLHPGRKPAHFPGDLLVAWLAVSPDGALVAINENSRVRLFDANKVEPLETPLHGHLNVVYGIAFSPDGRRLISSSSGSEAVKLWDVGTRQELLTLRGVGSMLGIARWSADGDTILAGDPWQAWTAPSWEEIAAAEAKEKAELRAGGL